MRREEARIGIMFCSILLAGVALAAAGCADTGTPGTGQQPEARADARPKCTRETLQKLADTYVRAQTAGNATLLPLAKGATYDENDKPMDVTKGMLAAPLKVDFTRSFYDTTQCASFTELVGASDPHPFVIHTRIEATKNGKVSLMESRVTHEGDWMFGAADHLRFTREEKWDEIPKDQRDTRAVIQAVADAYLDNWGDPTINVPHGTPCARLEGRLYTGTRNPQGNTCNMGKFPQKLKVGHRRYVIDETIGAVDIFSDFPWLDAGLPPDSPGTQTSNQFRVEGGKTRYIHEVTVCTTPNCGRGRPAGRPPGAPGSAPAGK